MQIDLLPKNIQCMMSHFSSKTNTTADITTLTHYLTHNPSFASELFHTALSWENIEVLKLLIFHKADIHSCAGAYASPALHIAVQLENIDIVRLLLHHKASVNSLDATGDTALHRAAAKGNLGIANVLLANGAMIDSCNLQRETPLHYAVRFKHTAVTTRFLQKSANVNAQNYNGTTPLHIAAKQGTHQLVRILRDHGANVKLLDRNHQTPEACARARHPEIADLISVPKSATTPSWFAYLTRLCKKSQEAHSTRVPLLETGKGKKTNVL